MARSDFNWELVNVRLDETHTAALAEFVKALDGNATAALRLMIEDGYKVSVTYIEKNEAFCVTVSGASDGKRNASKSMSSFSDDLQEAIFMTAFKQQILFERGNWKANKKDNWG